MMVFTFLFSIGNAFFRVNLVQNTKIVSLRLNLVSSLIRICRNILFVQILSQMSKLSAEANIWHLDWFEYAELNDLVHFFHFWPEILFLAQKFKIISLR